MFDFSATMHDLIAHIGSTQPEFAYLRPEQVLVSFIQTRTPGVHGVYASCQPLRFKDGERVKKHKGRVYAMPQLVVDEHEIMYIIYFAMPRFMNLDFETKLTTVFHELYHISPRFDGDIRRFKGKNYAHGHSRKVFNERVKVIADEYMTLPGASEHTEFLHRSFEEICSKHGKIIGSKIRPPRPKLVG